MMKARPSEHWVCLPCRKQFRKPSRYNGVHWEFNTKPREVRGYPCPECKAPLMDMGKYFKPPRREDKQAWEQVRLLAEHGIRFSSEDAVAFHRMITGPRPRMRQTRQAIVCCPCHTRTEGQRLLRTIARNQERPQKR